MFSAKSFIPLYAVIDSSDRNICGTVNASINLVKEQKNMSNGETDFGKDRRWLETECDRPH